MSGLACMGQCSFFLWKISVTITDIAFPSDITSIDSARTNTFSPSNYQNEQTRPDRAHAQLPKLEVPLLQMHRLSESGFKAADLELGNLVT